ncbi:MAG: adenylate/guanylate cyclase domain-containing protein [Fibrobacterales bacterium]
MKFIFLTGFFGHIGFYFILEYLTDYWENVYLRLAAIAIYGSYVFILKKGFYSTAVKRYFELSFAITLPIMFNIFLIMNNANVYWGVSLVLSTVIYGLIAQPKWALILYPLGVGVAVGVLFELGHLDGELLKRVLIINLASYFLMYALAGVQSISKYTFNELKQTKIRLAESEKISELTIIFEKFVPKQFISKIANGDISTIEFGKAKTEILTVLFSDIRNFTTISERYPPQELLDQLNIHFQKMSSIIHNYNGFVDKFIGDEIMALFDGDTGGGIKNALDSAIMIQKAQWRYNQWAEHHETELFNVGVGLHTGEVVIGTVGSSDRMDSTVLGDVVNVGARLESLTSYYGVGIIVSSAIKGGVGAGSEYHFRELDMVVVKGKSQPEIIFEVIEGNPVERQNKLLRILDEFHVGLGLYRNHKWDMALSIFEKCLNDCGSDKVLTIYVERCKNNIKTPPNEFWNPRIDFNI